jgi:hypothetical protein
MAVKYNTYNTVRTILYRTFCTVHTGQYHSTYVYLRRGIGLLIEYTFSPRYTKISFATYVYLGASRLYSVLNMRGMYQLNLFNFIDIWQSMFAQIFREYFKIPSLILWYLRRHNTVHKTLNDLLDVSDVFVTCRQFILSYYSTFTILFIMILFRKIVLTIVTLASTS